MLETVAAGEAKMFAKTLSQSYEFCIKNLGNSPAYKYIWQDKYE